MNITEAGIKILDEKCKKRKIAIDKFGLFVTREAMGRSYPSYKIKESINRIIIAYENKHRITDEGIRDGLNGIVIKYYEKSSEKRGKTLTGIKVFQEGDEDDLYEYLRNRRNRTRNQLIRHKNYVKHIEINRLLPIDQMEPLLITSAEAFGDKVKLKLPEKLTPILLKEKDTQ